MEILIYLSSSAVFAFIGYMFGVAKRIDEHERAQAEPFKEGYIKGYADCWAAKEADKKYYDDFPPMGVN